MVNEVEVEDPNAEPDKEYVYTIEHEVNVVNLSQSGCGVNKIEEKKTARDWDPTTMKVWLWSTAEPLSTCVPSGLET